MGNSFIEMKIIIFKIAVRAQHCLSGENKKKEDWNVEQLKCNAVPTLDLMPQHFLNKNTKQLKVDW